VKRCSQLCYCSSLPHVTYMLLLSQDRESVVPQNGKSLSVRTETSLYAPSGIDIQSITNACYRHKDRHTQYSNITRRYSHSWRHDDVFSDFIFTTYRCRNRLWKICPNLLPYILFLCLARQENFRIRKHCQYFWTTLSRNYQTPIIVVVSSSWVHPYISQRTGAPFHHQATCLFTSSSTS